MSARSSAPPHRRAVLAGSAALTAAAIAPRALSAARTFTAAQTDVLVKALADAPSHGFRKGEFVPPELADAMKAQTLNTAAAQAMLKGAVLAYARAQRGQRVPLADFPTEWSVRPAPYDPGAEFARAVAANELPAWLESLPPRYQGYQALRTSLASYRAIAANHGWPTVPEADTPLTLGLNDPRVAALRARLAVEDAALSVTPDQPDVFDAPLQAAVEGFQKRCGLTPDGEVGPPTLAALNAPVGQRILQIEANMERWRWLPRELPTTRIQVNIAAAVLAVYRDGEPVMAMKAVAGKPEDATPMLHANISSIVLNPPWHVPTSIATKEIWPKAHKDHEYLARNQYHVVNGQLVQKAGPKSALRPLQVRLRQPLRRLSTRYAGPSRFRAQHAAVQSRLRAAGAAESFGLSAFGGQCELARAADRHGDQDRRHHPRAARPGDPSLYPLLDGVRRQLGANPVPRGRL